MKEKTYEAPSIEKVTVYLEQVIAGSIPIRPEDSSNNFTESWREETITTENAVIL